MEEFCDLIRRAIEVAPSPGTLAKLRAIYEEAGCTPATNLEDSGGGGHTDPDG